VILQTLTQLGATDLRFLFVAVAGILERFDVQGDAHQVQFWAEVARVVEAERGGEVGDLDLDDVLDGDLENGTRMSRGLASGQAAAAREFFQELAAVLEVELQRRRREIIALERLR
jgi:hypothetical protein